MKRERLGVTFCLSPENTTKNEQKMQPIYFCDLEERKSHQMELKT